MYQRLSAVMFPVMALFFIGSIIWGYQEHQEKNSILIKAENQYQRAFHELSYDMEQLHNQLGNTLAVNSTSEAYHRKSLVNVWRLTSEAQNKINQLPLTLLPFHKTEEFLAHISNFTYRTAVRDLQKQPLSEKEQETLMTLYKKSEELTKDLQEMQSKVIQQNLRWMDVEVELASEQSNHDNTIINGFKTVDKKVEEYPEINWGPSVSAMFEKRSVSMLGGKKVSAQEVQQKAAKYLGLQDPGQVHVVENGQGTEYASYTASIQTSDQERPIQLDYSKNGGQLIWFMNPRQVGEKQMEINQAKDRAKQFLEEHDYPSMIAVSYDAYENVSNFTFVRVQDDVLIYPVKITVKIALDNGEPIGMQAEDYIYEHHERQLGEAQITSAEARKVLNPEFKLKGEQLALIKNDLSEEVLCYEFSGRINGHYYRIYVNAENGLEEKIEQLPELNTMTVPTEPNNKQ